MVFYNYNDDRRVSGKLILHVLNVFGVRALSRVLLSERFSFTVQYHNATSMATCLAKPFTLQDKLLNRSLLTL